MKLSISRETLFKALRHCQAVVEKRTSIAILGNVRLKATKTESTDSDNGVLELTATDNDLTIQGTSEAFVSKEGVTTVGAHKLFEIVSKIKEGVMVEMTLSDDGTRLSINADRSKFSLATLPADAFPDMTHVEDGVTCEVSSPALKRLMRKSVFAAANDETRAYLNGIFLHVAEANGGKVLRSAATDGHRLAQVDEPLPEGAADLPGVILPRKAVSELLQLSEENDNITLRVNDTKIQAEVPSLTLTSKVIDGSFPDYDKVIPKGNEKEMDVPRKSLMDAVGRVAILSHEKSRSVKFSLDKGSLIISANNPDQESAVDELKVGYSDDAFDVGFNARYVADIGGQVESEDVRFFFKDSQSPVLVKDPSDDAALFVVMPMRV